MKQILPEHTSSIAFVAFKHINDYLLSLLLTQVTTFNQAGLANLDLDLISVFNICETSLKDIEGQFFFNIKWEIKNIIRAKGMFQRSKTTIRSVFIRSDK